MSPDYDVQIKAIKPSKVVTVARFQSLDDARECVRSMTEIGFQPIVTWKPTETKKRGWDE